MIKVRPKMDREITHKFGCDDKAPCECYVERVVIDITDGHALYEAIKNPKPTKVVTSNVVNWHQANIEKILTY